jgi:hypothetical protein
MSDLKVLTDWDPTLKIAGMSILTILQLKEYYVNATGDDALAHVNYNLFIKNKKTTPYVSDSNV